MFNCQITFENKNEIKLKNKVSVSLFLLGKSFSSATNVCLSRGANNDLPTSFLQDHTMKQNKQQWLDVKDDWYCTSLLSVWAEMESLMIKINYCKVLESKIFFLFFDLSRRPLEFKARCDIKQPSLLSCARRIRYYSIRVFASSLRNSYWLRWSTS